MRIFNVCVLSPTDGNPEVGRLPSGCSHNIQKSHAGVSGSSKRIGLSVVGGVSKVYIGLHKATGQCTKKRCVF